MAVRAESKSDPGDEVLGARVEPVPVIRSTAAGFEDGIAISPTPASRNLIVRWHNDFGRVVHVDSSPPTMAIVDSLRNLNTRDQLSGVSARRMPVIDVVDGARWCGVFCAVLCCTALRVESVAGMRCPMAIHLMMCHRECNDRVRMGRSGRDRTHFDHKALSGVTSGV
jgi:hypothetical protein